MADKEITPREQLRRQEMTSVLAHPLLGPYIGPNAENYLGMWREQLETRKYTKQPIGFVILFSIIGWPIWYAYRKLYKELILCLVCSIIVGIVLQFILPGVSMVGISVALAFSGKQFYYGKVSSFFKKHGHLPEDELLSLALKKGGVSVPAAVITGIVLALFMSAVFASIYLASTATAGN